jgi:hypothetical protein
VTISTVQPQHYIFQQYLLAHIAMSSDWTCSFRTILVSYKSDFLAVKDSKSGRSRMIKKVRKAIVAAHKEQGEKVPLPSSFKKVLFSLLGYLTGLILCYLQALKNTMWTKLMMEKELQRKGRSVPIQRREKADRLGCDPEIV